MPVKGALAVANSEGGRASALPEGHYRENLVAREVLPQRRVLILRLAVRPAKHAELRGYRFYIIDT